jgi:sugar phosphate isomerase/epimerase
MWGINKFATLAEFFEQGRALGFTRFELNHAVDSTMLKNLNGARIVSIHEPCPADISVGELKKRDWLISATNENNRCEGVNAIKRSIDLAQQLGAPVVIVHPGKVDMDTTLDDQMRARFRAGKATTREFAQMRAQSIALRAERAARNQDAVRQSISELAEYAGERDIQLGLENRYHYFEIPLLGELEDLLNLGFKNVGFWYDVGHAETLDQLGFIPHAEWLHRFSARIVGAHLHDVVGIDDHRVAGSGQVDWAMVARYVPADAYRTCEFQNFNSPDQVRAGVQWLVAQGLVNA